MDYHQRKILLLLISQFLIKQTLIIIENIKEKKEKKNWFIV